MTTTPRTDAELWAALADPTILAKVNAITRQDKTVTMDGPGWHALLLDAIRATLGDDDIGEPETQRSAWTRCPCGKIHSPTKLEAQRKANYANRANNRYPPTRYYKCPKAGWHWAEKYTTVRDCECGHRTYYDARAASKAAERRNNADHHNGLEARAFQCKHGGQHVVLYPKGERLIQCDCGAIAYHSVASADTLLDHLDERNPDIEYDAYRCHAHHKVHIARADRFPDDAIFITEEEA